MRGTIAKTRHGLLVAGLCALGACAQFPELDAATDPAVFDRDYPRILPIDGLLTGPEPRATPEVAGSVQARAAALKARAARLGGPVVDARTKARMARGVPG